MTFNFTESYRTACVSTCHINEQDIKALSSIAKAEIGMVSERTSGFFVKLHGNSEHSNHNGSFSEELNNLLADAARQGYRCVEFDEAADILDEAPTFEY